MIMPEVNVLVYVMREESDRHVEYRRWLDDHLDGDTPLAVSELVLSGVLRVLTHPGIHRPPTPPDLASAFVNRLREDAALALRPGPRHWGLFNELCIATGAQGNFVPAAYHAALAIEHNCEWATTDRKFARFPGLRWRHPLDA